MDITRQVIERANELTAVLMKNYSRKINEAYLAAEDELAVALKVGFRPQGSGVSVTVDLSFVAEKVKDRARGLVEPNPQIQLFPRAEDKLHCGNSPGTWSRMRWYGRR